MALNNCYFERATNISVGAVLFLIGLGFSLISLSVLPFFGFLVALPVLGLSAIFLKAPRSKTCTL
jgi:uncharacterized membrane protein